MELIAQKSIHGSLIYYFYKDKKGIQQGPEHVRDLKTGALYTTFMFKNGVRHGIIKYCISTDKDRFNHFKNGFAFGENTYHFIIW